MFSRREMMFSGAFLLSKTLPATQDSGGANSTWEIGNSKVVRTIRFDASAGLSTSAWLHRVTGTDFLNKKPRRTILEFEFWADDTRVNGRPASVELVDAASGALPRKGKELRVRMRAKEKPLEIVAHYAVYGEHPVVRKWLSIRNTGNSPIVLTRLCWESAPIGPGPASRLETFGGYGTTPREAFYTGRASDVAMVVRHSVTGEGFALLNEAPAFLKRTEVNGWWDPQVQAMYDTDLFPFERTVAPGEEFVTAKSSIVMFADAKAAAHSRWVIPAYVSDVIAVRASFQAPWIYNTWMPFTGRIDLETCLGLVDVASRMGLDIFTIDAGWGNSDGVDLRKFPDGLKKLRSVLKQRKMALGLWVAMAEIGAKAKDAREHPEWLCRDRAGQTRGVMCLGSPYRELAVQRLNDIIEEHDAKYLKLDLTTAFNTYGQQPGCFSDGHYHRTWAESLVRIYEGLQYVAGKVHEKHPDVLLDYTFELWGEKHLIDHGLLQLAEMDWLSNVYDADSDSAGPRQCRALLYPRSFSIPPDAMLIGNPRGEVATVEEHLATALGSAPLFLGDLRKLTPGQIASYRHGIDWFKQLRTRVPFDAFFPLGSWQSPSAAQWDGFARLSRKGEGVIVIFANESRSRSVTVRIPEFPDGDYLVRAINGETRASKAAGSRLRSGWELNIPGGRATQILEVLRSNPAQ